MKIFTKAYFDLEQIKSRMKLKDTYNVKGIEIVLRKNNLDNIPHVKDILRYCSDNFETVSLETGDRLYGVTPTDLLNEKGKEYVEDVLNLLTNNNIISNPGVLVVHLAGGCRIFEPSFDKSLISKLRQDKDDLGKCLEYIWDLDSNNKFIALENTFPTDWMIEPTDAKKDNEGLISFYPFGKISSDFGNRIRTFDIAHSGISAYTYFNVLSNWDFKENYGFFEHERFGNIPVYFGEEERKVAELARVSLTNAVCNEIKKANIVNVHVSNSKGLLDDFNKIDTQEENGLHLPTILNCLRNKNVNLVTEVKEENGDYINIPDQKFMINYLEDFFRVW